MHERSNCQHQLDHQKSKRAPEKTSTSASLTVLKPLTVWITANWKILKQMGIPSILPASWEICMQVKKQQLESDMEKWTDSKLGKEYNKAVYCHPAYLTYIQWYHLHISYVYLHFSAILILACDSFSLIFHMMYTAYKLNKQGDNIQPCCTPFPILNQSIFPCPLLTVVSWAIYRFLRRHVRWSGTYISLRIFHNLLWSTESKALV